LQADPIIQDPYDSQSFNRYSYVMNNPLTFTDPSGYSARSFNRFITQFARLHGDFGHAYIDHHYGMRAYNDPYVRVVAGGVAAYFTYGLVSGWAAGLGTVGAGAAGGAAAGFAAGGIQGGNLNSALSGALTGAIGGGIGAGLGDAFTSSAVVEESTTISSVPMNFAGQATQVRIDPIVVTASRGLTEAERAASLAFYREFTNGFVASIVGGGRAVRTPSAASARAYMRGEHYSRQWGPLTEQGPLSPRVTQTFRSGTYTEYVTNEPTTLYRSYGGKATIEGSYWSKTLPGGPLQARIDSAVLSSWGNTLEQTVTLRVPAGVTLYEGIAAAQGNLAGGGNQVFLKGLDRSWIIAH
jgi:hypothetical protein